MWGIVGGSGFEELEGVTVLEDLPRETPFGVASSGFKKILMEGEECLFLSRHGKKHEWLPHEINYPANIFALKKEGATKLISFSSVGSLQPGIQPEDLVMPTQYINHSKRDTNITFAGNGVVGHVNPAQPTWIEGALFVSRLADQMNLSIHVHKTYLCIEGPGFSTKAESKYFQKMGADVIGMTGFPEYLLAREAGLCYLPCCFCTDLDSWDENKDPVTVEQVIKVMKKNTQNAFSLLKHLLKSSLEEDPTCRTGHLKASLYSSWEDLSTEQQQWLNILSH